MTHLSDDSPSTPFDQPLAVPPLDVRKDQPLTQPDPFGRQGGSAAGPETQDEDNLPMVVWLRGDEPYAEQFSLSADDVMQALDIKRSRLTQISGHELRVGRMRVDRYIRPMYRPEDVESYKNWTRATATHLRASSLLQEATQQLTLQTEQLSARFDEAVEAVATRSEGAVRESILCAEKETRRLQAESLIRLNQDLKLQLAGVVAATKKDHELMDRKVEDFRGELRALPDATAHLASLADALSEALDTIRQGYQAIRSVQTSQQSFARDVGRALALIIECQRESEKRRDEAISRAVREAVAPAPPSVPAKRPVARPRRRLTATAHHRFCLCRLNALDGEAERKPHPVHRRKTGSSRPRQIAKARALPQGEG